MSDPHSLPNAYEETSNLMYDPEATLETFDKPNIAFIKFYYQDDTKDGETQALLFSQEFSFPSFPYVDADKAKEMVKAHMEDPETNPAVYYEEETPDTKTDPEEIFNKGIPEWAEMEKAFSYMDAHVALGAISNFTKWYIKKNKELKRKGQTSKLVKKECAKRIRMCEEYMRRAEQRAAGTPSVDTTGVRSSMMHVNM